jgi:hypothetical protein
MKHCHYPFREPSIIQRQPYTLKFRLRQSFNMPHHPSEEETESHIFDKVAKGNPESHASNHPLHDENKEAVKATAADHKSKGPVIPESEPIPNFSVLGKLED